jgi:hypothetical protein
MQFKCHVIDARIIGNSISIGGGDIDVLAANVRMTDAQMEEFIQHNWNQIVKVCQNSNSLSKLIESAKKKETVSEQRCLYCNRQIPSDATVCSDAETCRKQLVSKVEQLHAKLKLLQAQQVQFREPERTTVCDIIANGAMLPDPDGTRYGQH